MVQAPSPPVVLVAEDEWLLRLELVDAFTQAGYQVVECPSGEDALAYLARGDHFDLLVTDIRLGGRVLGWDVAAAWRARVPSLPVVYVSANDPADSRRVDGSVFLSKPVVLETLLGSCEHLLAGPNTCV